MYHILKFYIIVFNFLVHKMNSKMIKSEIVVLTKREKTDMANADVAMN
jgi:hypothetical protein